MKYLEGGEVAGWDQILHPFYLMILASQEVEL